MVHWVQDHLLFICKEYLHAISREVGGLIIERNADSFVAWVIFIINSATMHRCKERPKVTVLKKYIVWNNSRHCYSYCMLSCSSLSEWLCEIAVDVQGYFHNSLLTRILGCCFYGGLLLLAFNHLGCILLSVHSHCNKQSSQSRYISLLNVILVRTVSSWILIMPQFILMDWSPLRDNQCCTWNLLCFTWLFVITKYWNQPFLKDFLQPLVIPVETSIWRHPNVHYQMGFVALLEIKILLFPLHG